MSAYGIMRPQLIVRERPEIESLPLPLYGSLKLDGVRLLTFQNEAMTRSGRAPENRVLQSIFKNAPWLNRLDGEIIVGNPLEGPKTFKRSSTWFRTRNATLAEAEGRLTFYVFDDLQFLQDPFAERARRLKARVDEINAGPNKPQGWDIKFLGQTLLKTHEAVLAFEEAAIAKGAEGVILRNPSAPYKLGRTTMREQYAWKLKRLVDSEAIVLGAVEAAENLNEPELDPLGYQRRSKAAEGLVGAGRLGALEVKDIQPNDGEHLFNGACFNIGSGFDHEFATSHWDDYQRDPLSLIGRVAKYRYMAYGSDAVPRTPIFHGWVAPEELDAATRSRYDLALREIGLRYDEATRKVVGGASKPEDGLRQEDGPPW